jgi:putative oxidoreductase
MFMKAFEAQTYALLRIVAGFLMLFHGSQKLFGFPPLPEGVEIPAFITYVAGPIELLGGILVMIGFQTRWAAFITSGQMAAAYFVGHMSRASGLGLLLPVLNGGELAVIYCFVFLFLSARGTGIWGIDKD